MVVSAAGRRLSPTSYATESAFVEHLRALRKLLSPRFCKFVVAMPEMSETEYDTLKGSLTTVDEPAEDIRFVTTFSSEWSNRHFALMTPIVLKKLMGLVGESDVVHSGISFNVFRPVEFAVSLLGVASRKKVISITDMDHRRTAEMSYRLGMLSKKSYLLSKVLFDPLYDLQQRALVKLCDLVLFKESQQVTDYGAGDPRVRLFLDPNYSPAHIASDAVLEQKIRALEDAAAPLRILYFGRLVEYKGVTKMIEAVALARRRGAHVTFDIMGSGPDAPKLKGLVEEHGIADIVTFLAPVEYGDAFFEVVRQRDLMLACPLLADTPRSTWDALASGVPLLAFDSPFYRSIAALTGAVDVTPWPEVEPFAARLVQLAADKRALVPMAQRGVEAARGNTGDQWLERRVQWVEDLFPPMR